MEANAKILVVDDIPSARRVLVRLLAKLGFANCTEAANGKEALSKIESDTFELVICDVNLGDLRGPEVLRQLRANPQTSKLPFVLITSDPSKEDVIAAAEAGKADFLLKPFSKDSLHDKILEAVKDSQV